MNPYQGLKLFQAVQAGKKDVSVLINMNPYQGLKQKENL